jgi:hypothetical protein
MLCGECGHHSPHDGSACPRNGCKWVCYWLWQRTRVRFPFWDLNWLRIAYEVDAAFRQPISPKNLLDRPVPTGIPACFSMEFALVRSSPQRFDCVLSIVVWCGVPPHHHYLKNQPFSVGFFSSVPPSVGVVSRPGLTSATSAKAAFPPPPTHLCSPFSLVATRAFSRSFPLLARV